MSAKTQHNNILLAIIGFSTVVVIVAVIGFFALDRSPEIIQGEVEVTEYRVSSKVPGRILELRVKEGDFVRVGDTLAILDAPDVEAKKTQAMSAEDAAAALSQMAQAGARQEQINGAYQVWQQASAGLEIARKSYERVQRLFDEGVMSAQKRDEALANYKAFEAQEKAAKSQYEMAKNGARREEKQAAQAQVNRAKGAVEEVNSYIHETVQVAQVDGEVSSIYPKVGELFVGNLQCARRPAEGAQGGRRVHGLLAGLQQRTAHEGVLHQRRRLIRGVEGYQNQRTVRPENIRGESTAHTEVRGTKARHVADSEKIEWFSKRREIISVEAYECIEKHLDNCCA